MFAFALALFIFGAQTPSWAGDLSNPASLNEKAPDSYKVKFDTSQGSFEIEVHRDWAPNGADRFYNLVKNGFYNDARFFRVIKGFMVQFGINGNPKISQVWLDANIPDDPVEESNLRGFVTFATAGPNTRTTQVFINYGDNPSLDGQGFAPFGKVVEGMTVIDKLYAGYGETSGGGMRAGHQGKLFEEGNAYLDRDFHLLDRLVRAEIIEERK